MGVFDDTYLNNALLDLDTPLLEVSPSSNVNEGQSVVFKCKSQGTLPVAYQWYKNTNLLNETTEVLIINKLITGDQGNYFCTASNAAGRKESRNLYLTTQCKYMILANYPKVILFEKPHRGWDTFKL